MARRRRKQSSAGAWVLIALLGVAIVAVGGGLTALFLTAVANREVLTADLCPDAGPVRQTLVLVDTTDPIPSLTRTELQAWLGDLANTTDKGALLELRTLTPDPTRTTSLFSLCNPGDGADLDVITGNPEQARKRWQEGFAAPLDAALDALVDGKGADTSPIMAGIQQMAVDHLASQKDRAIPTLIVIVSDMLENTEFFSHYRDGADFEQFLRSQAARRYATDLAQADIAFWVIPRSGAPVRSLDLVAFWTKWATWAEGRFDRARQLQGME